MKQDLAMHKLMGKHDWTRLGEIEACEVCGKIKGRVNAIKAFIKYIKELLQEIMRLRANNAALRAEINQLQIPITTTGDTTTTWIGPGTTTTGGIGEYGGRTTKDNYSSYDEVFISQVK